MLVRFTDSDDTETWINPIHVRVLRTWTGMLGGKKGCEVWFGYSGLSEAVHLNEEPESVARKLNAAMPTIMLPPDEDDGDEDAKVPGT